MTRALKTGRLSSLAKLCLIDFLVFGEAIKAVEQSCPRIEAAVKTFSSSGDVWRRTNQSDRAKQSRNRITHENLPSIGLEIALPFRKAAGSYTTTLVSPPNQSVMKSTLSLLKKKQRMVIDVQKF